MLQISYTSSGWVKLTSTKSCQIKGWLPDISTLNVTEYSPSLPSPPSLLSLPRPLPPLPSPSLPHFFFKFFFLANRHFCTPAHAHKHYPTAVPANCLCVLRPASLGINLWCNHGYRTTGNYKISSIFNVPLIVFECVLMEKGIEEMKQCFLHEESGGWEPVFDSLEFKPRKGAEHLEMRWCAYKYVMLSPAHEICGLKFGILMIMPKQDHTCS